ncbi:hypothetical protein DEO72_LG4g682 [Vigna unguiculata]|uniref:Uncharacterized protein n=1 Tax=Vigna unguiculata TaxID=3917 RepID=A0A4D6LNE6_VIGUN|nr:hypothetical protein DEO72_LG4g682 [Vigna unguiculata]
MVYPANGLSSVSDVLVFVVSCTDSHQDWVGLQCTACVAYVKRTSKRLRRNSQSRICLFSCWVQDRKECIGWMPEHWEGRTLSEMKGHGDIPFVINGSPIGKPYPSFAASLRSLDF